MRYSSRIKQLEKRTSKGNGEVHIKVARYDSNDNFDERYALFQARKVLGLVSFDEQQRTIFVCGPETKARYENMTVAQAKKILAGAAKKERNT
jgi:hypothetical protein